MQQQLPPSTDLLDRVLRDLSPEQKARVLELVVRLELDTDDPLWLVAIALGQLQVLVEDAPEDWQTLFGGFQGELTTWTNTHLKTLEVVADKARVTASLSEYTSELSSILKTLVTACNALIERLQVSQMTSHSSDRELRSLNTTIESEMDSLKALSKRQHNSLLEALESLTPRHLRHRAAPASAAAKLAALFSGLALMGILGIFFELAAT
ncbi:MAG: DUF6753 family protein [Cyanobacteriota bacterium]|nr:DUF6753 family protein [Cyanobacteriota bacterium]